MRVQFKLMALAVLWCGVGAWAGPEEVCHVGAQLHLWSSGVPDESYMRHVRAFVEGGLADYALLVMQGLKDKEREQVVRYLAEHKIHFLIQDGFPSSTNWFDKWGPAGAGEPPHARYSAEDYERIRS